MPYAKTWPTRWQAYPSKTTNYDEEKKKADDLPTFAMLMTKDQGQDVRTRTCYNAKKSYKGAK